MKYYSTLISLSIHIEFWYFILQKTPWGYFCRGHATCSFANNILFWRPCPLCLGESYANIYAHVCSDIYECHSQLMSLVGLSPLPKFFWTSWSWLIRRDSLARKPQSSFCILLLSSGITGTQCCELFFFPGYWWIQVLTFAERALYWLTHVSSQYLSFPN